MNGGMDDRFNLQEQWTSPAWFVESRLKLISHWKA